MSGDDDNLLVQARSALLDALDALAAHADSVVIIGAQAIYLHTGAILVAVAETTKDSDIAIDVRTLGEDPLIEEAMKNAGFHMDNQPGAWLNPKGIPVDLMVPESLAGAGSRSVEAPPHDRHALRRAVGLEAAMVDNAVLTIRALGDDDTREVLVRVAGPAALLVAKLHKLGERNEKSPNRLNDKDAYDVYRLLVAVKSDELAEMITGLLRDEFAREVTEAALNYLNLLFEAPESAGSAMAGRAEQGVGNPDVVSQTCSVLTKDLLTLVTGSSSK